MKTYKISFKGVKLGAIGAAQKFTETVKALGFDKAVLMLYCNYELISIIKVNGINYNLHNKPE